MGPGGLHDGEKYSNCTGGAAGYIDRLVLGYNHVYKHPSCMLIYNTVLPYDPEGILGILTSCFIVQLGAVAGRIIFTFKSDKARLTRWFLWSLFLGLIAGFLCGWKKEGGIIPVNKNLWSLSFVLTTASFAFVLLSVFYIIIDVRKHWDGEPLSFIGMNAILLYMGHEIMGDLFPWSWNPVGHFHYQYLFMNMWGTGIWVIIAHYLYRKKIFITV